MAAYRRVYDSRHLQADCQEPGSASSGTLRSAIEYGLPLRFFNPALRAWLLLQNYRSFHAVRTAASLRGDRGVQGGSRNARRWVQGGRSQCAATQCGGTLKFDPVVFFTARMHPRRGVSHAVAHNSVRVRR